MQEGLTFIIIPVRNNYGFYNIYVSNTRPGGCAWIGMCEGVCLWERWDILGKDTLLTRYEMPKGIGNLRWDSAGSSGVLLGVLGVSVTTSHDDRKAENLSGCTSPGVPRSV